MARPLRIELAGGLYHVTSRGDRREAIYLDDGDRRGWLDLLGEVCERFNWRCHAYCQMTNHYHLVVETPEGNLANGMRHLNGVYTQHVNRTHRRVGLPPVWDQLRQQIYLGSGAFVARMQAEIEATDCLAEVPRAQRRAPAKPLSEYLQHG